MLHLEVLLLHIHSRARMPLQNRGLAKGSALWDCWVSQVWTCHGQNGQLRAASSGAAGQAVQTRGAGLGWVRESQEAGRGSRESRVVEKALRDIGGPWSPAHGGPTALVRLRFSEGPTCLGFSVHLNLLRDQPQRPPRTPTKTEGGSYALLCVRGSQLGLKLTVSARCPWGQLPPRADCVCKVGAPDLCPGGVKGRGGGRFCIGGVTLVAAWRQGSVDPWRLRLPGASPCQASG